MVRIAVADHGVSGIGSKQMVCNSDNTSAISNPAVKIRACVIPANAAGQPTDAKHLAGADKEAAAEPWKPQRPAVRPVLQKFQHLRADPPGRSS